MASVPERVTDVEAALMRHWLFWMSVPLPMTKALMAFSASL